MARSAQNACDSPKNNPRRAPYCGAQRWTWSDERQVIAQSGAEYHFEIDARSEPQIGCAARRGDMLLVIQMDEVVGDVGELLRGEAELRRLDILALGGLNGDVAIDGKKIREV